MTDTNRLSAQTVINTITESAVNRFDLLEVTNNGTPLKTNRFDNVSIWSVNNYIPPTPNAGHTNRLSLGSVLAENTTAASNRLTRVNIWSNTPYVPPPVLGTQINRVSVVPVVSIPGISYVDRFSVSEISSNSESLKGNRITSVSVYVNDVLIANNRLSRIFVGKTKSDIPKSGHNFYVRHYRIRR